MLVGVLFLYDGSPEIRDKDTKFSKHISNRVVDYSFTYAMTEIRHHRTSQNASSASRTRSSRSSALKLNLTHAPVRAIQKWIV